MQAVYRIQVEGELDKMWSEWFGGIAISYENARNDHAVTVLTGYLDQAALSGVLSKIFRLNMTLLSVVRMPLEETVQG